MYRTHSERHGSFLGCTNYPASCFSAWDMQGNRLPKSELVQQSVAYRADNGVRYGPQQSGRPGDPEGALLAWAIAGLIAALFVAAAVAKVIDLLSG